MAMIASGNPFSAIMKRISIFVCLMLLITGSFESCTSTPPIRINSGKRAPHGIAQIKELTLGNYKQWVLIRGTDTLTHPVLLWLHGGPGASATALSRKYNEELEKHFTVVYWDQRGAGKSFTRDLPPQSIRVGQYIEDTHELVQYLKIRFNQEKILLIGHSWGSRLGMYMIHKYPQDFSAFVGIGQEVAEFEGESQSYQYTLQKALETRNQKALKDLQESGPPIEGSVELYKNGFWGVVNQKKWLLKLGGERYNKTTYTDWIFDIWFSREYSLGDLFRWAKASASTAGTILADPDFHHYNFIKNIPEVQVPVYFISGKYDYNTPWPLVEHYHKFLKAPYKQFLLFEKSGHSPAFEEPEKFNNFIISELGKRRQSAKKE
jgi:pimeloyl-ACP methyl ester carboxylesterase